MGTARLDRANPPVFSDETLVHLDALPPGTVEAKARHDPDNPPLSGDERARVQSAAAVRAVRMSRGMTQADFAETYGIAVGRLRDWEKGRFRPDTMAKACLDLIRRAPDLVAETLDDLRRQDEGWAKLRS